MLPTSYRGITLLSVINKVLEKNRMRPILEDLGVPHINETAYQKNVSCTDTIFATHE